MNSLDIFLEGTVGTIGLGHSTIVAVLVLEKGSAGLRPDRHLQTVHRELFPNWHLEISFETLASSSHPS